MSIEWICLQEFYHFSRRHIRYFGIFLAMYSHSFYAWKTSLLLRAGFCLAQHVDDVLDGDRIIDGNPEFYVRDLIAQVRSGQYRDDKISRLAHFVLSAKKNTVELEREFVSLCETLLFDWQRVAEQLLLSPEQLYRQHYKTFAHSLNLTLILAESSLRACDLDDLIAGFSWCSPIRDLREDLARGLVNIPNSVITEAQRQGATTLQYEQLIATPAVCEWLREEYRRGKKSIDDFVPRIPALRERKTRLVLGILARALQRYAYKYRRQNEFIH